MRVKNIEEINTKALLKRVDDAIEELADVLSKHMVGLIVNHRGVLTVRATHHHNDPDDKYELTVVRDFD